MPAARTLNILEWLLWAACLGCVALIASAAAEAHVARMDAKKIVAAPARSAVVAPAPENHVIGRLDIADVSLSVPVVDNFDPDSLTRGVGHIPGTANPGGLGNLGLAGHRDTFFRPLRNVKIGMNIDISTAAGRFRYAIDSTEIVTPEEVRVLDIGPRPEMTLITCYPFNFVGAAPRRFIVHAHLLSADPAPNSPDTQE